MAKQAAKSNCRAATFIELLIVVIIIGLVAALALPLFPRALETTKAKEAVAALKQIRTGERVYKSLEEFYYPHHLAHPDPQEDETQINNFLKVLIDTHEKTWSYQVDTSSGSEFTATATRTSGEHSSETLTINQDGNLGGSWSLPVTGKPPAE